MTDTTTLQRRGRIDEVGDLAALNLAAFSHGANPPTKELIAGGFRLTPPRYRSIIEKWGFAGRGDIADLASGIGRWSVFLAEVNQSVVGYDRNLAGVELASGLAKLFELPNLRFEVADIVALPTAAATFDGVWLQNSLQIVDRASALGEAWRILKPDGLFFVGQYSGLGKVLDRFFQGYARGGVKSYSAQSAILSLKQGPLFNGRGSYASKEHLAAILDQFGFRLSPTHPVEVIMSPKATTTSLFAKELRDLPTLGDRLEMDSDFAAEFARHPELADAFPVAIQFCAMKN